MSTPHRSLAAGLVALPFALALALMPAVTPALAQDAAEPATPPEPVEVSAETLEVNQAEGYALFSGNVVVVQGPLRLAADTVRAEYGAGEEEGARMQMNRLHAVGNVVLTTADEAAEAAEAVYDVPAARIVLTGDVVLAQNGSAMSGDRLVYDLTTRSGRMEGRVRTILLPGGGQ